MSQDNSLCFTSELHLVQQSSDTRPEHTLPRLNQHFNFTTEISPGSGYYVTMETYLVGGAVRDKLLNRPTQDRDWVVTGATVQEMLDLGFVQVGKDFPVFLHPDTHEEYALARTERKTHKGYHGFECFASPEVTLEQDLQRRDLTINAMAEDSDGHLIDPYNGQQDLLNGILRHVSEAFAEDPVRILRIARFAARYARQNFHVAHSTNKLMRKMVAAGEVDSLVAERCWAETRKALEETDPVRYFQVLRGCGALAVVFPEIDRLYPDQKNHDPHGHAHEPDIYKVLQKTLDNKWPEPRRAIIRFAILMVGLYQHTGDRDTIVALCDRLRIPNEYRQLALTAVKIYQTLLQNEFKANARDILGLIEKCDGLRKPEQFKSALLVCRLLPDLKHYCNTFDELPVILDQCLEIHARSINTEGLQGKQIGEALHKARLKLINEKLRTE